MKSKKFASVQKPSCVACGTCVKECPRQAITIFKGCHAVVDENMCLGCGKCGKACPASCIVITEELGGNKDEE